jgi:hypothetical protein
MLPDTARHLVRSPDLTVSLQHVLLVLVAIFLTWSLCSSFYNVYFHPLAKFPGPKLAAASKYWLFYQEIIRGISLSEIRDDLHAQYGTRLARFNHFSPPFATFCVGPN